MLIFVFFLDEPILIFVKYFIYIYVYSMQWWIVLYKSIHKYSLPDHESTCDKREQKPHFFNMDASHQNITHPNALQSDNMNGPEMIADFKVIGISLKRTGLFSHLDIWYLNMECSAYVSLVIWKSIIWYIWDIIHQYQRINGPCLTM